MLRVPTSTYRIQFNAGFTFNDAERIAPYLADLGITELYASPILRARKGSQHGYDVVDAATLNPELGTEEEFSRLHETLRKHGMGFLLDIVPNHMATGEENAWWMSVLENGPQSRYLHYFDIEWSPVVGGGKTRDRVLLPILGRPYGEAVESGEIKLCFDADGFFFRYYDKRLPLAPGTYNRVLRQCVDALPATGVAVELRDLISGDETVPNSRFLKDTLWRMYEQSSEFHQALDATVDRFNGESGKSESFNELDALLDCQYYRLAYWRIASEKINYRRFFDVTDLVGVRIEHPEVFEARNRRHFEMIAEGKVTGLRIDHIDGLYDPVSYLRRLQLRLAQPGGAEGGGRGRSFYVVVEKILAASEKLPENFDCAGTTGYDYIDTLNGVMTDADGLRRLSAFYRSFTGLNDKFDDIVYERKKQVIAELFSGEMRALGKKLGELSMHDRNARDFAPVELLAALTEITASMDVYRTYFREGEMSDADREFVRHAVAEARGRAGTTIDQRIFTFLERVLLVDPPSYVAQEREKWLAFVMRWQQFTGRVMAKGVEDTAFYNYNVLLSLNEVGCEPARDERGDPLELFHERNERVARDWPDTLNTTSTHDTKRSEDVRARLHVISEIPDIWEKEVRKWSDMNASLRRDGVPDRNVELLVYQTLLGMWPLDQEQVEAVGERLKQYLEKAAREAKAHTSWIAPNADYEKALFEFAEAVLSNEEFRNSMTRFERRLAYHGFLNSLTQVVLKVMSPGVPDFYQGTEVWDLSLVDPDNRRPVDYESRRTMLAKIKAASAKGTLDVSTLLRRWFDGRVKLFVTWKSLDVRKRHVETFRRGGYRALRSDSPSVIAFARGEDIVVVVPRLTTRLVKAGSAPVGEAWVNATLRDVPDGSWKNAFTGDSIEFSGGSAALRDVFARFPVAILERT